MRLLSSSGEEGMSGMSGMSERSSSLMSANMSSTNGDRSKSEEVSGTAQWNQELTTKRKKKLTRVHTTKYKNTDVESCPTL